MINPYSSRISCKAKALFPKSGTAWWCYSPAISFVSWTSSCVIVITLFVQQMACWKCQLEMILIFRDHWSLIYMFVVLQTEPLFNLPYFSWNSIQPLVNQLLETHLLFPILRTFQIFFEYSPSSRSFACKGATVLQLWSSARFKTSCSGFLLSFVQLLSFSGFAETLKVILTAFCKLR